MKKKQKEIFEKAYKKLTELYSGEDHAPDIRIINRFYDEKKILQESELYICYLDFIGRLREIAEQKGEDIMVRGTTGSLFIAYLLGATDVNPLPLFEYCPHCKTTKFLGLGNPFDCEESVCSCKTTTVFDGHNIPFESNLKSVMSEHIQIAVSYEFFNEAKKLILDEKWGRTVVTLENEEIGPMWFCFADKDKQENISYAFAGNTEHFADYPRITLAPNSMLDKYHELVRATGVRWEDHNPYGCTLSKGLLCENVLKTVPQFKGNFYTELFFIESPQNAGDLLKMLGLAHSTDIWRNNAEDLFYECKMTFSEIPAFREDLYEMICDKLRIKAIYETGFAYEVTEKAQTGYYARNGGVDRDTKQTLSELGFDMNFIMFIGKINYMFPKAHGVSYLKDAIKLMFYKLNFSDEYDNVMENDGQ